MPRPRGTGPIRTIVIDAGHGGKDPGALGKTYKEKELTLKMALKLKAILNKNLPKVRVILTRGDDRFIPLHQRAKIAQMYKADFFVSIHCNASPVKKFFGSSTYILGINHGQDRYNSYIRENEVVLFEDNYQTMYGGFDPKSPEGTIFFRVMKNAFRQESSRMASKIQTDLKGRLGRKSLGVKQAPFIVLWQSGMPSVLVETGFITNRTEELYLGSETGQNHIASSLYRAIRDYNHELE
ncbi:MAG: N-acetylmuramoyl-L-alanine amidase [Bacteroidia bacterium]